MDSFNDIEQLINTIKTAKLISETINSGGEEERPAEITDSSPALEIRDGGESTAIRSIKAAIPYLDNKYRRNMGIAVKLMEIDSLLTHCDEISTQSQRSPEAMLMAVRAELPRDKQPIADFLMKLLEIKKIALSIKTQ